MKTSELPPYLPTESRGLVRDTRTHALLNTDAEARDAHRRLRAKQQQQTTLQQEVTQLKATVSRLEDKLDTLSALLTALVEAQHAR